MRRRGIGRSPRARCGAWRIELEIAARKGYTVAPWMVSRPLCFRPRGIPRNSILAGQGVSVKIKFYRPPPRGPQQPAESG